MQSNNNPINRMPRLRVSLGFARGADHVVEDTAGAVSAGLFGNSAFPNPPVTKADLDAASKAFGEAISVSKQGGMEATADKNNKREILEGLLRQLAGYVQERHHNDLAVLLSSGFKAVGMNAGPAVLARPIIRAVINGQSTQIIIRVKAMKNVRVWKLRRAAVGPDGKFGPYEDGGLHTDSRRIIANGLTPGVAYAFQVQAAGSGNTHSEWSDVVQHRSL